MPTRSGWVFRIEIVIKKSPFTKNMAEHLQKLFMESEEIAEFRIQELFEEITLFKSKKEIKY